MQAGMVGAECNMHLPVQLGYRSVSFNLGAPGLIEVNVALPEYLS
jgi:hypothetical protein